MTTSSGPRYLTLRLLCANAVGMVAFLSAFVVAEDFAIALIAGLIVGAIGYVASSAVVDYAAAGAGGEHD
ncbi:hypothetical protein GRS48_09890 [Halorubrum sp. JWXQ-INN 858]|uniref:hypothetical protein n=1 Tax=Halorubrum sp. JWXQ-INN 858 TaxID=2690782 RepID=UPI00135BBDE7|nr:hypothetical protein [Halorubrum sp. JWXQ-INN 858]MWV65128.1 hypothetical protein [Halorubrum sp. JWXQ-INN 858]